jgi:hypothetical protein
MHIQGDFQKGFEVIYRQCERDSVARSFALTLARYGNNIPSAGIRLYGSLIKIGAKKVRHSKKVVFQMAEVAVPRELFRSILQAIGRLRLPAVASG